MLVRKQHFLKATAIYKAMDNFYLLFHQSMRKGTECVPCFLAKEMPSVPNAVVEGNINLTPNELKSYLDPSGKPLSWSRLGGILWLVQVTLSLSGRLRVPLGGLNMLCLFTQRNSIHIFYRSKRLSFAGWLGKNVLWQTSSHLNKHEHSMGLPERAFSGQKVEKPLFSSLEKLRGVDFLVREVAPSSPTCVLTLWRERGGRFFRDGFPPSNSEGSVALPTS